MRVYAATHNSHVLSYALSIFILARVNGEHTPFVFGASQNKTRLHFFLLDRVKEKENIFIAKCRMIYNQLYLP